MSIDKIDTLIEIILNEVEMTTVKICTCLSYLGCQCK